MANNLKLDSNWDIIPGRGMTRTGGVDYVAQNTKSHLQTRLGECFDSSKGVPWNQSILGSTTISNESLKDVIRNAIVDTPDVVAVTSLELTRDNRVVNITFSAISSYGNFSSGATP